jgi:amidase
MANLDELADLDATAQAALVWRKEVTPLELVEAAIERIEKADPELNAVVTRMYDEGRLAAAKELPAGPFAGVPFLLKDIMGFYGGTRSTLGSKALADNIARHDSELVRRYKAAGLIVLGKTNVPEFGLLPTTESELHGRCRNPWNTGCTTGGSSGGSASAVAAGMVPMAHANDGGGSIRIPASCCGLFGLKPTRGRNPLGPDFGDAMSGMLAEHAVTRSVRDSAALLDATCGPDPGDPYNAPEPERPYLDEVGAPPGRLRIAFSTSNPLGNEPHPDCAAALEDAVALCGELGHEMVSSAPEISNTEIIGHFYTVVWTSSLVSTISAIAFGSGKDPSPEMYEPLTWALYERGLTHTGGDYLSAITGLQRLSRKVANWGRDFDLWLTPTLGEPPVPLGTFDPEPDDPWVGWVRSGSFCPYTGIANVTGQPAMSVPLCWNDDGLPIGIQFIGHYGDEATLFRLAAQLEQARPWANKKPPIWAG